MRVLFTTWAWPSHLYALVPLAWACRAAGHEVLVAGQPGLLGDIAASGLPGAAVGTDVDAVGMVRGYLLPTDPGNASATAPGRGPRAMEMFLAHAESMTGDLLDLARRWRPDLVVHEPTALAGPLAAAALGVPSVRVLYGTDLMRRAAAVLPGALAPLAERYGAKDPDPYGTVTVDPVPTALQIPHEQEHLAVRHVPYNGPGALPAPPPEPRRRPRICVTWGHTIAKLDRDRFLAGRVARAVAGLGADVVLAVSTPQLPLTGPLPDGVRVVTDTPLHHLLGTCDLVVAHGGAGTVLAAAAHGLPQLLIPQLPDHAGHAGRVVAAGAGEVLTPGEATPERIRAEAERLLADGPERAAARALRDETHSRPAPAHLVPRLEQLAVTAARDAA
ncbi:nucleotide disphospho-sugar-binding domain-containing protein [Streptomyces sp. NPDC049577]|uniref:nucleotide disphospho-sugar-binding domain-containing protein n=1 Tax=Streptomyces sp. NPDC049577 TaxID=3155153 RepID=UPI00343EB15F